MYLGVSVDMQHKAFIRVFLFPPPLQVQCPEIYDTASA